MTPRTVPEMVPRPPKMLVPPKTTAAMTSSSIPVAASARVVVTREVKTSPARPGHEAAKCVSEEFGASDVQTREARRGFIVSNRIERSSQRRSRQEHCADDGDDDQQVELDGQAIDLSTSKEAKPFRKAVNRS